MIDLAFALSGGPLPPRHRLALALALEQALPWLASEPLAGVHRLNLPVGTADQGLLSGRTRLTLRLPRERLEAARALEGARLDLDGTSLTVGAASVRPLLAWGTLYAHCVAVLDATDEPGFLADVAAVLARLGVRGRVICGRRQDLREAGVSGYALMVDGLKLDDSLSLLRQGVGPHRRLGCGVFVPHKSAAAVGTPE